MSGKLLPVSLRGEGLLGTREGMASFLCGLEIETWSEWGFDTTEN